MEIRGSTVPRTHTKSGVNLSVVSYLHAGTVKITKSTTLVAYQML